MPFSNTLVTSEPDRSLCTTVYRKPAHTDQYLHWENHEHFSAKFSVFNTLKHRVRTVCSNPELLQKEEEYIRGPFKDAITLLGLSIE